MRINEHISNLSFACFLLVLNSLQPWICVGSPRWSHWSWGYGPSACSHHCGRRARDFALVLAALPSWLTTWFGGRVEQVKQHGTNIEAMRNGGTNNTKRCYRRSITLTKCTSKLGLIPDEPWGCQEASSNETACSQNFRVEGHAEFRSTGLEQQRQACLDRSQRASYALGKTVSAWCV